MRNIEGSISQVGFGHFARLLDQLPPFEGAEELVLLKGHLLVEELLHAYIMRRVPNPDALQHDWLSFAKCLMLCRALTAPASQSWGFEAAEKLNAARNEVAHELDSNKRQNKLEAFYKSVEQHQQDSVHPPKERGEERLWMAISGLYHELNRVLFMQERTVSS